MFDDLKGNNLHLQFPKLKNNLRQFQKLIIKADHLKALTRQVFNFINIFYVKKQFVKNYTYFFNFRFFFSLVVKTRFLCYMK